MKSRKPRGEWLALMPGAHEGYVDWERAEAIRRMVSDNVPTSRHHGAPKHGHALLVGLGALPALQPEADGPLLGDEAQHPALLHVIEVCSTMASRAASPSAACG